MASDPRPERDPLDAGEPGTKAWEEFAVQFSGVRLLSLLLSEIAEVAPDFFDDIKDRFYNAYQNSDDQAEEDEGWDPDWVNLETPAYLYATDRAGAAELYGQFFPHGDKDISLEHVSRGLALVGFHSALELYFVTVTGIRTREELPKRIGQYLKEKGQALDPAEYEALIRLDETRHVIIHHRGTVSERYVANVAYGKLLAGERRDISNSELWRMGDLVWFIAGKIRKASAGDQNPS